MTIVYIGLGSNERGTQTTPVQNLASAIHALGEIQSTQLLETSSFYNSKPIGPQDQADYCNAVVKLATDLNALALLDCLQAIEDDHGRVRCQHWGPRTLDLDVLLFGDQSIQNKRLTIPHVELCNRAFVLIPLAEIDAACVIPDRGTVSEWVAKVDKTGLRLGQ